MDEQQYAEFVDSVVAAECRERGLEAECQVCGSPYAVLADGWGWECQCCNEHGDPELIGLVEAE